MTNKLDILIVEDNDKDCKDLTDSINAHADKLSVAGVSKSAANALEFIRNHSPHAVILDLELQEGSGDGMELLDKLRSTVLTRKPYVVVNTNNASKVTIDVVKRMGADYTFAKWQKGYSTQMVINHLLLVMPAILGYTEEAKEPISQEQMENRMREFVQSEFNKLGVSVKNAGYTYLVEAVILAAKGENQGWGKIIGKKYGKSESGVMHAMQYAVNSTWTNANVNDLHTYYTAPMRRDRFVPTATEFIFFYKQKLINFINN